MRRKNGTFVVKGHEKWPSTGIVPARVRPRRQQPPALETACSRRTSLGSVELTAGRIGWRAGARTLMPFYRGQIDVAWSQPGKAVISWPP